MSAHDRRIVHLALQEDKSLRTWSTGTGLYRKVIISPEKKSS
jgi:spoIIIJ-associated protein